MQELRNLETSQLIDLLSQHTADYTKMMTDNMIGDKYEKCKLFIKALQTEIDFRKTDRAGSETTITAPSDFS